jgi:AraC-like DNA-binding protein
MTPLEYRDALLMGRAKLLLRDGTFSIKEIADVLGFESVSYFSRFFKKNRGLSPSQYMKQEK